MRANYHTHSEFCDGKSTASAMAEAAFLQGYRVLGFSSHAPLPFPTIWNMDEARLPDYAAEVRRLAALWADRGLEILLGLEIDWIEGVRSPTDALFEEAGLDYRICSVHFIKPGPGEAFNVDGPEADFDAAMARECGGDGRLAYLEYYRQLSLAIERGGFDILGHLDLVVRNNRNKRWFDEDSRGYLDAAFGAIDGLQGRDIVVEINLGPLVRGKSDVPHPSLPLLRRLREGGVAITFSADAHATTHFGHRLETAREFAKAAGYRSVAVLTQGKWRDVGIDET